MVGRFAIGVEGFGVLLGHLLEPLNLFHSIVEGLVTQVAHAQRGDKAAGASVVEHTRRALHLERLVDEFHAQFAVTSKVGKIARGGLP